MTPTPSAIADQLAQWWYPSRRNATVSLSQLRTLAMQWIAVSASDPLHQAVLATLLRTGFAKMPQQWDTWSRMVSGLTSEAWASLTCWMAESLASDDDVFPTSLTILETHPQRWLIKLWRPFVDPRHYSHFETAFFVIWHDAVWPLHDAVRRWDQIPNLDTAEGVKEVAWQATQGFWTYTGSPSHTNTPHLKWHRQLEKLIPPSPGTAGAMEHALLLSSWMPVLDPESRTIHRQGWEPISLPAEISSIQIRPRWVPRDIRIF